MGSVYTIDRHKTCTLIRGLQRITLPELDEDDHALALYGRPEVSVWLRVNDPSHVSAVEQAVKRFKERLIRNQRETADQLLAGFDKTSDMIRRGGS